MKNNLQNMAAFFIVASLFLTSFVRAQGVPATSVPINAHCNIASDSYGNVFIADADNNRVLIVSSNGMMSNFAGAGAMGFWGDGGPAVSANLNHPSGVAVDAAGNVYIADTKNNRIRMVNLQGIIITVAGSGQEGYSGDGGPAIYASLNEPTSVAVDANRDIYIGDNYSNRIRMVNSSSGTIYAIAGNGASPYQENVAVAPAPQPVYASAPAPVTYQSYYDELSPYGQWIDNARYGNVWVPAAGPDFTPYSTDGHWVYTEYGWTWVSDYSWGWLTFHYGRWDFDNYLGWFWVPGNEWAPAWVLWRSGNGYYGWAPLPPDYGNASETNSYDVPHERYVFVQNQYITDPDVHRYYVPREQSVTYVTNTVVVNRVYVDNNTHTTVYSGPPKEEVEKYSGAPVKLYTINSSDKPGQTGEDKDHAALTIYRPKVEDPKTTVAAGKPAPAPTHVFAKEEVKPVTEREVKTQPKTAPVAHEEAKPEQPHTDVALKPENTQPNKPASVPVAPQQNDNVAHHQATTPPPAQAAAKPGQPATAIKDKQVGKDAQGHVIYRDQKGNKYYVDAKGKKVIVPPPAPPKTAPVTPGKPN